MFLSDPGWPPERHRRVRERANGDARALAPHLRALRHGLHGRLHRLPRACHDVKGIHAGEQTKPIENLTNLNYTVSSSESSNYLCVLTVLLIFIGL